MNASVHAVSDDRTQLATAGVDHQAFDRTTMGAAVVTEIRSDGTGAEVHLLAED